MAHGVCVRYGAKGYEMYEGARQSDCATFREQHCINYTLLGDE